ncbi:AAA family ATPase [Glaciecola sp. KUL10]|uniref:AAA family ATPase n=1 Tax=Glaciecola sp. (strain KUL10) TaxID=2161813 RepID=UPI000D782E47|nr:AAA family ATPase [Glaciecola sp. KUL10]
MLVEADEFVSNDGALIGQERAKKALNFGLGIEAKGYNLYVMGEQATGRFTLVQDYINKIAKTKVSPDDYCYLNNFDDERQPVALKLASGHSTSFVKDVENLLDEILDTFPAVFENPSFQRKKAALVRANEQRYDLAIDEVESYALERDISLIEENGSISFSPIIDGEPISDKEFASFDEAKRQSYYQLIDNLETRLNEALIEVPMWQRETAEKIRNLKKSSAEQAIKPLVKQLEHKYRDDIAVLQYLKQMNTHLIDTVIELMGDEPSKDEKADEYDKKSVLTETYVPNVLIKNIPQNGAPIVYEANPNHQNLFGKIEYTSVQGSVYTNYRMIVSGALHRANGGYLLLDADKLLEQPYVWESLKLALKSKQLKMELPQQEVGMSNSITQTPQSIPLKVKVVLMGSRELYYALQDYDEEFKELVRVLVDFDTEIDFNQANVNSFVAAAKKHSIQIGLESITQSALKRLVEYSFRLAEHQSKLSARVADVIELINEAHYFASQSFSNLLDTQHIEAALEAKRNRTGRASESLVQEISEGHVLIDTDEFAVGKVNGLTVLEVGDTAFGTPARITSTVYAGASGVVDIEREVELGQSIHSKGVMLLTGYLGNKYAQSFPLTVSANIALEQSYGYIDGDSASLGELIALISALTDIPVDQGIAITGSINQYGEVQAVGGVNEKIEGFFSLCYLRGLNGNQGVIIPRSNKLNLVLDKTIIDAVAKGDFNIFAVSNVDEAIEILMKQEAGELSSRGRYPKRSVHYHAVNRLYNIANIVNGSDEE